MRRPRRASGILTSYPKERSTAAGSGNLRYHSGHLLSSFTLPEAGVIELAQLDKNSEHGSHGSPPVQVFFITDVATGSAHPLTTSGSELGTVTSAVVSFTFSFAVNSSGSPLLLVTLRATALTAAKTTANKKKMQQAR